MSEGQLIFSEQSVRFLRRKCSQVLLSFEGCLSDEGTLSFGQSRWFAICEPLEFAASVTTEALGGHYQTKERQGEGQEKNEPTILPRRRQTLKQNQLRRCKNVIVVPLISTENTIACKCSIESFWYCSFVSGDLFLWRVQENFCHLNCICFLTLYQMNSWYMSVLYSSDPNHLF